MKRVTFRILMLSGLIAILSLTNARALFGQNKPVYALVIHGGAGVILQKNYPDSIIQKYTDALSMALDTGSSVLSRGGSSLDAVEKVVRLLEDNPFFNAGKGAVFNHEGKVELDASIMEGKSLKAGAVAGVGDVKNPVSLARKVMENSPHVMLAGKGASVFAKLQGLEIVDSSYFYTQDRWDALQKAIQKEKVEKFGTVGCVALDIYGNLAAATSTGGMTNKRYGRIGDSPVIGAGTYANNKTCAVSCTGHGEFFIRYTVAHDVSALMEYKKLSLPDAAREVIQNKLKTAGGEGGLIAVDAKGTMVMEFNTPGMFRACADSKGNKKVAIFRE